jgi:hypothetical protein
MTKKKITAILAVIAVATTTSAPAFGVNSSEPWSAYAEPPTAIVDPVPYNTGVVAPAESTPESTSTPSSSQIPYFVSNGNSYIKEITGDLELIDAIYMFPSPSTKETILPTLDCTLDKMPEHIREILEPIFGDSVYQDCLIFVSAIGLYVEEKQYAGMDIVATKYRPLDNGYWIGDIAVSPSQKTVAEDSYWIIATAIPIDEYNAQDPYYQARIDIEPRDFYAPHVASRLYTSKFSWFDSQDDFTFVTDNYTEAKIYDSIADVPQNIKAELNPLFEKVTADSPYKIALSLVALGSGSIEIRAAKPALENGEWRMYFDLGIPEMMTMDMAYWIVATVITLEDVPPLESQDPYPGAEGPSTPAPQKYIPLYFFKTSFDDASELEDAVFDEFDPKNWGELKATWCDDYADLPEGFKKAFGGTSFGEPYVAEERYGIVISALQLPTNGFKEPQTATPALEYGEWKIYLDGSYNPAEDTGERTYWLVACVVDKENKPSEVYEPPYENPQEETPETPVLSETPVVLNTWDYLSATPVGYDVIPKSLGYKDKFVDFTSANKNAYGYDSYYSMVATSVSELPEYLQTNSITQSLEFFEHNVLFYMPYFATSGGSGLSLKVSLNYNSDNVFYFDIIGAATPDIADPPSEHCFVLYAALSIDEYEALTSQSGAVDDGLIGEEPPVPNSDSDETGKTGEKGDGGSDVADEPKYVDAKENERYVSAFTLKDLHIATKLVAGKFSYDYLEEFDVNDDGEVTKEDITIIARELTGEKVL